MIELLVCRICEQSTITLKSKTLSMSIKNVNWITMPGRSIVPMVTAAMVLVSLGCLSTASVGNDVNKNNNPNQNRWLKLPKIFDFELFKSNFKRTYSGLLEESKRKAIYIANSFKVFLHNTLYAKFVHKFYLGITELADRSRPELKALNSLRAHSPTKGDHDDKTDGNERNGEKANPDEYKTEMIDEDQLKEKLEKVLAKNSSGSRVIKEALRDRLSLEKDKQMKGELKLEKRETVATKNDGFWHKKRLIPDEFNTVVRKRPNPKFIENIPIEEQNPEHLPPIVMSQDLSVPSFSPSWNNLIKSTTDFVFDAVSKFGYLYREGSSEYSNDAMDYEERDSIDWRTTNCFTEIKRQLCGSCWAFTAIAKLEFEYCRHAKHLAEFSEQYLVDCSPLTPKDWQIDGCSGSTFTNLHDYINVFGVELARDIPHREPIKNVQSAPTTVDTNNSCPVSPNSPYVQAGIIRPEIILREDIAIVERQPTIDIKRVEEKLEEGPLVAAIATNDLFLLYKGGIDSGSDCDLDDNHAMLLVGHGYSEEDKTGYWIFRNSYGPSHGEEGYYKSVHDDHT
ncbi:Cathepsin L-like proteinase, partial [Fragariocoptes setiger]